MKHEKSCGACVYTVRDGKRLYLIENMRHGHFAMPKGHVEAGETEKQTAEREILEETGLRVSVNTGFRSITRYSPASNVMKEVVFFIAYSPSMETVAQLEEVESLMWLPFERALSRLTYENDKEVLRRAEKYAAEHPAECP